MKKWGGLEKGEEGEIAEGLHFKGKRSFDLRLKMPGKICGGEKKQNR